MTVDLFIVVAYFAKIQVDQMKKVYNNKNFNL